MFGALNEANDLVHLQYGYDHASNRTYRRDEVARSYGKSFDELYEYDGLNQLKKFHRGLLVDGNTVIESPALQQAWQFDATGNWSNFTTFDPADATKTLDQQRLNNRVNEITEIARTVGANWATPTYDRNGNMTGDETDKVFVYDAWNRLAVVKDAEGATLKTYAYDGLNRRIADTIDSATTNLYYSESWQVLEERIAGETQAQYVWSLTYVDAMVLRDRLDASERLWVTQDANWNVVGLVNGSGEVVERYVYDAYGVVTVQDGSYGARGSSSYGWVYGYQGLRYDATAGLNFTWTRPYSPTLGQPVSVDRLGLWPDVNPYRWVYNSPVNFVDPSGLLPPTDDGPRIGPSGNPVLYDAFWGLFGYPPSPPPPPPPSTQDKFTAWYNRTIDVKWTKVLPDCPCSIVITTYHCDNDGFTTTSGPLNVWTTSKIGNPDPAVWEDPKAWQLTAFRNVWKDFHPGATYDMRSKKTYGGHAQQCTYDAKGNLITHGPGAGTPDWSPAGTSEHISEDVDPFLWALELDGGKPGEWVNKYLERRPPNPGKGCAKNP